MSVLGFLVIRCGFRFLVLTAPLFCLCFVNHTLLSEGQSPLAATPALPFVMIIASTWHLRA